MSNNILVSRINVFLLEKLMKWYRSAAIHSPWGYIETQKISMAQKLLDKKIIILSHTCFLSFDITPWATNHGTTVIKKQKLSISNTKAQ